MVQTGTAAAFLFSSNRKHSWLQRTEGEQSPKSSGFQIASHHLAVVMAFRLKKLLAHLSLTGDILAHRILWVAFSTISLNRRSMQPSTFPYLPELLLPQHIDCTTVSHGCEGFPFCDFPHFPLCWFGFLLTCCLIFFFKALSWCHFPKHELRAVGNCLPFLEESNSSHIHNQSFGMIWGTPPGILCFGCLALCLSM